jgi:processive 1,2-diacylglycerol beta-glucosyltransferase
VIVNPIPGQEEKNAIYLLEQGVGLWADNVYTLGFKVRSLLEQPGQLEAMRKNALRIGRPDAGAMVAGFAVNHVHPEASR